MQEHVAHLTRKQARAFIAQRMPKDADGCVPRSYDHTEPALLGNKSGELAVLSEKLSSEPIKTRKIERPDKRIDLGGGLLTHCQILLEIGRALPPGLDHPLRLLGEHSFFGRL